MRYFTIIASASFLAACSSEQGLTGKTVAELNESYQNIRLEVPAEHHDSLDAAFDLALNKKLLASAFSGQDLQSGAAEIIQGLQGMTAQELLDAYCAHNTEAFADEIAQLKQDAEEARSAYQDALDLVEIISVGFTIENARFYWGTEGYYTDTAVLEYTVTNNLDIAISSLGVRGVLKDPSREVPIVDDTVFMGINAGLEPGETKNLSFAFSSTFGAQSWSNSGSKGQSGAIFTLSPYMYQDAEGNQVRMASDDELSRLKEAEQSSSQTLSGAVAGGPDGCGIVLEPI